MYAVEEGSHRCAIMMREKSTLRLVYSSSSGSMTVFAAAHFLFTGGGGQEASPITTTDTDR